VVLITGNEVLRGRVRDENGPALAADLEARGLEVVAISVVPDRFDGLVAALARPAADGVAVVVVTGGLGPTHDDLTMAALAQAADVPLVVDAAARGMVEERAPRMHELDPADREGLLDKQGSIPRGAHVLEPAGTAPGCVLEAGGTVYVALPGPPWERAEVWERAVVAPALAAVLARARAAPLRVLRVAGRPESDFATAFAQAPAGAREAVELGVCARDGELEVTIAGPDASVAEVEATLADRLGDALYSTGGERVEEVVGVLLAARGERLALAESCTGGLVGGRLTNVPGASGWLLGGVVAYDDIVKRGVLGVPGEMLARHGAVSEEVALAMAEGARRALGAEWGLSVTGVAGPGGGTAEKPVGLVHIACAGPGGGLVAERHHFRGVRERVRARSVVAALHLLRRRLLSA
jgi:nicotinamide-nucleotide amidase